MSDRFSPFAPRDDKGKSDRPAPRISMAEFLYLVGSIPDSQKEQERLVMQWGWIPSFTRDDDSSEIYREE